MVVNFAAPKETRINHPTDEDWNQRLPKNRPLWAALVCIPALVLILSYFGIIPWKPPTRCRAIFCDPYHWQVLVIGIAFLCAGLALIIPADAKWLTKINGLILLSCFIGGVVGSLFFAR